MVVGIMKRKYGRPWTILLDLLREKQLTSSGEGRGIEHNLSCLDAVLWRVGQGHDKRKQKYRIKERTRIFE